jgi:acyl carrier protein
MTARDLDPGAIEPRAKLSETLGLRSMDLAQIVLTLEDDLNTDPFQQIPITSIRTVGDLTQAYLVSLGLSDGGAPGSQDMAAEMAAAKARMVRRRR